MAFLLVVAAIVLPSARADEGLFKRDETTVALWNLGEMQDNVIRDKTPSGIDLKPTEFDGEAPPAIVEGKSGGKALMFPGKSSLLELSEINLETPKEVTVEAWIKLDPKGDGTVRGIFQCMAYAQCGFRLSVRESGVLGWMIEDGTKEITLLGVTKLTSDEWTHVAGTYDGATMKVYLNGKLDAEKAVQGGITKGMAPLFVARISAPGPPYFIGAIQAIRVSKVALTKFDLP